MNAHDVAFITILALVCMEIAIAIKQGWL